MNKLKLAGLLVLTSTLALSGCVARTYELTRDRVDQDLTSSSGNRGYLMGNAPEAKERPTTRTTQVFEIELGRSKRTTAPCPSTTPAMTSPAYTEEASMLQEEVAPIETVSGTGQKYTVQKNDTLQKISMKYFGTTKNWYKIYQANKDVLSGPDKLYPGQTITIPNLSGVKMKEPEENLK
ncbi:MAG: LysM peptidoglycan-binding domain-containing protein [Candidatus Omnitrophica bacterium]|nr:LysM peptidoglycan-binding domain-containing protein [Candidatus Omnitrophota bacterium]